eukprot:992363-Amphidinium_carterae.1
MKGKANGQRKGKRKGNNGKGKNGKTEVTCYTCGKQGHTSTTCYYSTNGKNGKGHNKGSKQQFNYQQPRKGYPPQQPSYQQHYDGQPPQYPSPPPQQHNKGYSKGHGKQWNQGRNSYNQEWFPEGDYSQQLPGQEVEQQQVLQQQQSGHPRTSYLTMGSLYEIDAIIHIGRRSPRHLKDFNNH